MVDIEVSKFVLNQNTIELIENHFKLHKEWFLFSISEDEKQMIIKATSLSGGHWFECPNGHSYAIGECGGAMEESKCPECGAKIGGQSH